MGMGRVLAGVLPLAFAASVLVPVTAVAATGPAPGECYRITDAQSYEDYWPTGLTPVPCSGRHSIQITRAAVLPADVNAFEFAADQCDYASVWKELGINQATDGIVTQPIRIDSFSWTVRGDGAPARYVCGAGPLEYRGRKDAALVSFTGKLPDLGSAERARLQFCTSARGGRGTRGPVITVPCSSTPRWQVTQWIMWDDFYSTYPGEAVLTARARKLCGAVTEFSVPKAKDWPGGTHRSWCYVKHT